METHAPVTYGEHYLEILRAVQRKARPRVYLEIGVWRGTSLRLASPTTRVVGIDPDPQIVGTLPRRWTVHAETSDAFFARPDAAVCTGVVDVAFIDGLHHYDQVLRDLAHVERRMAPDGVILIHDCLPPDASVATREPTGAGMWAGDVWKIVPVLHAHRPDITVTIAAAAPTGLAVITGLDPSSTVLLDDHEAIVAEMADVPFAQWPTVVPGTWAALAPRVPTYRRPGLDDVVGRPLRDTAAGARRRLGRWRRRGVPSAA